MNDGLTGPPMNDGLTDGLGTQALPGWPWNVRRARSSSTRARSPADLGARIPRMEKLPPTAAPRVVSQEAAGTFGRLADVVRRMDDAAREEGREPVELPPDSQRVREVNAFIDQWQR